LHSFLYEAVTASYLERKNWKIAFLPYRNSYEVDMDMTKSILCLYGKRIITIKYMDYKNKKLIGSEILDFELINLDVYDIKKEYELNTFIMTNAEVDFIVIYGPFDYTCISGSEEFVKALVSKEMQDDFYEEIKSYVSVSNKENSLRMYYLHQKKGLLVYS
jgi:hypothetical protein